MDSATTQNYLGRCAVKGCDYALFATPDSIIAADNAKAGGPAVNVGNGQIMGRCTNGHRWFMLRKVKGTYSDKHTCDSRCLNARGHDCTCSCGGANHGRGYAVTPVTVNATAHEQWRDKLAAREQVAAERYEPITPPVAPAVLPEPGQMIRSDVEVIRVTHNVGDYNATLFMFKSTSGRIIKWFAPDYKGNFAERGDTLTIRAKVKSISEWQGAPEVIVTHVEKVEGDS